MKFTDDTGEFALTTMLTVAAITAAVFGLGNVGAHMIRDDISFYDGVKYFFSGAVAGFLSERLHIQDGVELWVCRRWQAF